jgi:glycosyltransferase involved in cell wall biosynthesis
VSVVIPAYNAERTIRETLVSVLRQTMADFEVIVVDDGSTDATAEVAASLADPRLRVLRQHNTGHAGARNSGIEAASGKYVAIVDADDLWLPRKLETQLGFLSSNPNVRALHSGAVHVDDSLRPLFIGRCPDGKNTLLDVLIFRGLPGIMCTLIAERALLDEIGRFDASLIILQDWDLAIRMARRGELHSISEPLALYRVHSTNQSRQLELHIEPGERILASLFQDPDLPADIEESRSYVYAYFYAMLCGGAFQLHRFREVASWGRKAIVSDLRVLPYLLSLPLRRAGKRISRTRAAKLTQELPLSTPVSPSAKRGGGSLAGAPSPSSGTGGHAAR